MKDEKYYFFQTPPKLASYLMQFVEFKKGDSFLEPFKGEGNFYRCLPEPKDWCEIEDGRDFFEYNKQVDIIVSNPPFRIEKDGKRENAFIPCLEKCLSVARKSVNLLINHKMFLSITPTRLQKYSENGWYLTGLTIVSVKKWFGRYYFIQFTKNGQPVVEWCCKNW